MRRSSVFDENSRHFFPKIFFEKLHFFFSKKSKFSDILFDYNLKYITNPSGRSDGSLWTGVGTLLSGFCMGSLDDRVTGGGRC